MKGTLYVIARGFATVRPDKSTRKEPMELIKKYAPALLYCLPALAFFAAGSAKLAGVPQVVKPFADMGLPAVFGLFIGLC